MAIQDISIVIVAAVARNGVIGGDNRLLWRISSDLQRFKTLTLGKPLVMGRKTFESIGRALPGRETIVVTRDRAFCAAGVLVAHDLESALQLARERAAAMGAGEIVIAGGGELYAQAMAIADRLEITHVNLAPEGDAIFPRIDTDVWRETSRVRQLRSPKDEADFAFSVYERVRNLSSDVEMR